MSAKKSGLGKGLDSLFSENASDNGTVEVRLSEIEPNRDQPRKYFKEEAIEELAESIRLHGLIQPLLVRPIITGGYQIIAGERRWRASRAAGLTTVPVIIREMGDEEAMELALIENLQREDLNPVEEALGYKSLMDNFGMTQEAVAERVGKSRPAVANALRLLGLTEQELEELAEGNITSGHARTLLSITDEAARNDALKMAKAGCSVRELEDFAKRQKQAKKTPSSAAPRAKNKFYTEVEIALTREVGRKITVTGGQNGGTIHIEFWGESDLKEMAERIAGLKF